MNLSVLDLSESEIILLDNLFMRVCVNTITRDRNELEMKFGI